MSAAICFCGAAPRWPAGERRRWEVRGSRSSVPASPHQRGGSGSGRAAVQHHPGCRHRPQVWPFTWKPHNDTWRKKSHDLKSSVDVSPIKGGLLQTHCSVWRNHHVSWSSIQTGARDQTALLGESLGWRHTETLCKNTKNWFKSS